MASEKQSTSETRSQPRNEDMDIGYEDSPLLQTFQGLEQKFLDDIMKLANEQNDAEDAENSRHREVSLYIQSPFCLYLCFLFISDVGVRSFISFQRLSMFEPWQVHFLFPF